MDDQFSITVAKGPSHRQQVKETNLNTIGVITKLGARYLVPDVTPEMFDELMKQIDLRAEKIILRNVSDAMLVLPYRIIESIIHVKGVEMQWGTLWEAQDG